MPENRRGSDKKRPAPKTAFKPGKSGNPGGRPKKTEEERTLEAMCRERTPDALGTIIKIMDNGENERNRLSAAQFVIERGWGKSPQAIELTGKDGGPIQQNVTITPEEAYKRMLNGGG